MTIAIIDLDMGNCGSIANILGKLKAPHVITNDSHVIAQADKLILPGVGAFDFAVMALERFQLRVPIRQASLVDRKPILGICLGMQLMAHRSEEGKLSGLELIAGEVHRFSNNNNLRIPHMGWNRLQSIGHCPLLQNLASEARFYFVHSYHFVCDNPTDRAAFTNYGSPFTSVIHQNNIMGVQFHPEKSHRYGFELFKRFVEI